VVVPSECPSWFVEAYLLAGENEGHQSVRRSGGTASSRIVAIASSTLIIF
jgi:hypothetical protein